MSKLKFNNLKPKPIKRFKKVKDWAKEISIKPSLWKRNHSPKPEDVGKYNLSDYWRKFVDSILTPLDEWSTKKIGDVIGVAIAPYVKYVFFFLIAAFVVVVLVAIL